MVGSAKVTTWVLALAASVCSSPVSIRAKGCGKNLPSGQTKGGTFNVTISSIGLERSYLVFIPPGYSSHAETPVIFSYHGGDRTAEDQLELDELTSPEFNKHAFVVYPQGINASSWRRSKHVLN